MLLFLLSAYKGKFTLLGERCREIGADLGAQKMCLTWRKIKKMQK